MTKKAKAAPKATPKAGAQADDFLDPFKAVGELEGYVSAHVSYDIIQQFSAQLYTNPRKAIEELVCNSYDAGAKECHVQIPADKDGELAVLDNGGSMDFDGLKGLWRVASSPKTSLGPDRTAYGRKQIGKFGVGKLAAYALGNRLTHIATRNGTTRIVTVASEQLKTGEDDKAPRFEVVKMAEKDAREVVKAHLGELPLPWTLGWKTWTLALVGDVSEDFQENLKVGFLRRMITTALPVNADFRVYLDKVEVPARHIEKEDIALEVPVTNQKFRTYLEDTLKARAADLDYAGDKDKVPAKAYKVAVTKIADPTDVSKKLDAISVPEIGAVAGRAIIGHTALTKDKVEERGYRNHGFAVYVRGKQVNPEDELWGVSPRSMGLWSKFRAELEFPELDEAILVQRNAVSDNKPGVGVARELVKAIFNFARSQHEEDEEQGKYTPPTFGKRIATQAPLSAPLALSQLAEGEPSGTLEELEMEFATGAPDGSAVTYDREKHAMLVNEEHPVIANLADVQGGSTMRKVLGEAASGALLAEGYLLARGVKPEIVEETSGLLDSALRSAAGYIRDPIQEQIQAVDEASYGGDKEFELAIVRAFKNLHLAARRKGLADEADGEIHVPVAGQDNLLITVEAKGSHGTVTHKELGVATLARHRKEIGGHWTIAVAREIQLDGLDGKRSAAIREAKDNQITLVTTAAIAKLLTLHGQRPFTYREFAKILMSGKDPDELEAYIVEVWKELPPLGVLRDILEAAHEAMEEDAKNLPSPDMLLLHPKVKKHKLASESVDEVIRAVATTTQMIVIRDPTKTRFELLAPVQVILDAMQARRE